MDTLTFLQQDEVKVFIRDHVNDDIHRLLLSPPHTISECPQAVVDQIISRRKAKNKLRFWSENYDLIMPPPLSIEQASSTTTARYKEEIASGSSHLIDLTGGMGVDCLTMGSYFATVTYVEPQPFLCEVFQHNSEVLEREISVVNQSAEDYVRKLPHQPTGTIAYLDPARRDTAKKRVFEINDCVPNLNDVLPRLSGKVDRVLIKLSPLLDIQSIVLSVDYVKEIHVVSVKNDCKELLVLVDFSQPAKSPIIHCVNLESPHPPLVISHAEEKELAAPAYSTLSKVLLEPNASILKAGAFKSIAHEYSLRKVSNNTHLYTTDETITYFPGRIFLILDEVNKASLKKYAHSGKINVITRNYPLSATQLKSKWKLKDGGSYFLIGYRDTADKPRLIIAERLAF